MSSGNEHSAAQNAYNMRNGDPTTMGSLRNLLESLRFDMHGTGGGDFDNNNDPLNNNGLNNNSNNYTNNNTDGNAAFGTKEDETNFAHQSYSDVEDEAQRQQRSSDNNNYRFNDPNLTDDDDESFATGSYGPSEEDDDSVESFEDAGYDNEEDYLFDQYGGIGGTAEERAELAEALMHTLNVGPMADDLFYEEVAMCFLRCRERHRMRTKREEMRQRARQKKLRRKKKQQQHHQKGGGVSDSDHRRTESEISDTGDEEEVANRMRKMNMGNVESDFNLNRRGTEDDDSIEDDVNVDSDYHIDSDYNMGTRRGRNRRRMKSSRGGYSNNNSNIDEEDRGVDTANDADLSTEMSSSDRDDEDSFMGGKNRHHSPPHRRRHQQQTGNHFGDSETAGVVRVEEDMENDYEDDTAYGVYGGVKEDEDHDNVEEEEGDEDVPVFRVNLKSEKPNNRKKGHAKKAGGGRYPPPPPPPPPPRGGDHHGPPPAQNYDVPSSPMDMEVDEDIPNEGSYSWQETLANGAKAAAEASAMKNDHESLRKGFSIGQSSSDSEKKSSFAPRKNKSVRGDISQAVHNRSQTLDDATEMVEETAEGSDKRKLVSSLRDEGRSHYINGAYRESVQRYTEAISAQTDGFTKSVSSFDETLAALYGNRAAALMMTGAYEGAAADCGRALQCTEDHSSAGSLESGPAFRSKILCRMARACLKAGSIWDAEQAFNSAIQSAQEALALIAHSNMGADETRQAEKILNQSINDATLGLTDVRRYREALEGAAKIAAEKGVTAVADRRNSVQLLMFINSALSVSPGSMELHERKVNALASLKRWAELGNHCERLAAEMAKIDGVFKDDLSALNPFPDVRPATSLKSDFFERNPDAIDDPAPFRILSPKAVCEAVLRLPNGIIPLYLRSLRLEERYTEAAKAGTAIETHMSNSKHKSTRGSVPLAWLSNERDKLRKTMSWKEKGDGLFRKASYEKAAEKYGSCLTIDSDSNATYDAQKSDIDDAGGRLHAVLHCNRAACLMAMKKYREAVKECTAALRIHTHYMKAMLRRGRCFARIRQYQEAVAEYERYIQLVDEAKRSPHNGININAACTFDRPADITDAEYSKAKQELSDVKKSMRQSSNVNSNTQANSKKQAGHQQWYNSQFAKAAASNAAKRKDTAGRSNAYTRKQQWDAGANQRRYDPFGGSSPKKTGSKKKDAPPGDSRANRTRHNSNQQPQQPNVAKNPDCHYEVLGLSATASSAEIKKSYHKMALKYHPDKNQAEEAADIFRRVKLAYEVLGDDSTRIAYDAERRRRR